MQLPFSVDQFFRVISHYNETVWPAQVPLVLLALVALALVVARRSWSGPAIAGVLALLWAWLGIVFHLGFFTTINPLAYAFAALSVAGAGVFAWHGLLRKELAFALRPDARSATGLLLITFALLVYPAWSTLAGHAYPALPTFGLPCPTTIFTIGMLAFATGRKARIALVVPVLWSLVGGQAAFLLDVPPDFGLLAAGLVGIALALLPPSLPATVPA
jgi:hypothetical protein